MNDYALLKTPLFERHTSLKARMVPFAGYEMPVQYSSVLDEAKACRSTAALFDVSHMGQLRIRGKSALSELNRLVTNDLRRLKDSQAQYSMLCDPDGGVIDDLVIYRVSEEEFFICANAANVAQDVKWIREHLRESSFENESEETALIALQGPRAESLASRLCDAETAQTLPYYYGVTAQFAGVDVWLSRTGYTGEDGFEIYCPASAATKVWDAILEIGKPEGVMAAGLGARDILRLEMGYPLHGFEISRQISPLEAGLGWVVRLEKEDFIGKAPLLQQKARGVSRKLIGLRVKDRRIPRSGSAVRFGMDTVGTVTSGGFSPHLNHPIALALVAAPAAAAQDFDAAVRESFIACAAQKIPFVPSSVRSQKKSGN